MLSRERPDLVTISLPNEAHFEATLEVIEAGVPVLAEKPLVFDLAQADELIGAASRRDLFFAINFNHRYAEPVRRAKVAIDAGDLGELVFATWRFGGEPGRSSHPHANLIETQCHGLDMLEFLVRRHLFGHGADDQQDPGGYSTLAVALEFASGAVGCLVAPTILLRLPLGSSVGGERDRREVGGRTPSGARHCGLADQPGRCGKRVTSTTSTASSIEPSTSTPMRCSAHCASPPSPRCTRRRCRALELAEGIIRSFERGQRVSVPAPGVSSR